MTRLLVIVVSWFPSAVQTSEFPDGEQVRSGFVGVIVSVPPLSVVSGTWLPPAVATKLNGVEDSVPVMVPPLAGETVIAVMSPRYTVAVAVALRPCTLAVIVAVPSERPSKELLVGLENVATDGVSLDHVMPVVTAPVLPLL